MLIEDHEPGPLEELKRADHLVYVSLKYTRTGDIMKNAIKRMISAYEMAFGEVLELAFEQGSLEEVPGTIKQRAELAQMVLGKGVNKHMRLYSLLKRIDKSEYSASSEYRKDLTLHVRVPRRMDVKMDDLFVYLEKTGDFVKMVQVHLRDGGKA